MPTLLTPTQYRTGSPNQNNQVKKRNKSIQTVKEGIKLSLFAGSMILCIENPKDVTKKLLELINEFSKVVEYKNQHTENSCISIY